MSTALMSRQTWKQYQGSEEVPELKQRLQEIQASLGLSSSDLRQRLQLLQLDVADLQAFDRHLPLIDRLQQTCMDALLAHLSPFERLNGVLSDSSQQASLKQQQLRYFGQLVRGPYDMQYARLRVLNGIQHERNGVDLKWYLGAYHFYLDYMADALEAHFSDQLALARQLYRSLRRAVFFDMSLAVDTYSAASRMALEDSEARYQRAVQGANDGLWEWHVDEDRLTVSPRWQAMLGLDEATVPRTLDAWAARMPEVQQQAFLAAVTAHLEGRQAFLHLECQLRDRWGQFIWVLVRGLVSRDQHGERLLAGSQTDISQRKQAERELMHATLHDPLTGLPNRERMNTLLLQALQRQAKPGARHAAVLFIDLDRFKLINDSLGHQVGDQVLVQVATRIERCLRPGDHLCRFGGDEFVVLLDDMAHAEDAERVAKRIMHGMQYPVIASGNRLNITASIGVAPLNGHDTEQDALREADLALYRAKAFGKSQLALFNASLQQEVHQRLKLETALGDALGKGEFELFYQPIVEVAAGRSRVIGVEALLRWWQGDQMIGPDAFIPVLEETGDIVKVGDWVLRQACAQVREWQEHGLPGLRCSVNLSSRQLLEKNFASRVAEVLAETGLPPKSLVLEITESLLMQDGPETLATMRELESTGVRIALDDFGTGFSSLGYLHRYPLHIIKIDKSFISQAPDDERLKAISRAVIGLGKGLSMDVIAEGIETSEQMDFLSGEGCHLVQGYWFSRPQSAVDLKPWLLSLSQAGPRSGVMPDLIN